MSNVSRLEKISLLTLVQGAKYYPITRQENLEILGEIGGGAKITDQILEYEINFEIKTQIVRFNDKRKRKFFFFIYHVPFEEKSYGT